jgi:xylulose-5-phosphate/fructose-6-phosphate phosphoketolase
VRGYKEQGTITTPFDMAVLNDLDRFHLASDALVRLPHLGRRGDAVRTHLQQQLTAHRAYIRARGEDLPEIRDWRWPNGRRAPS